MRDIAVGYKQVQRWNLPGGGHDSVHGLSGRGYAEVPWRRASRTMSTRPLPPSLARMCEI
jgi:hypothetical protein